MNVGSISDLFDILRDPTDTTRELTFGVNSNSLVNKQTEGRTFKIIDEIPDLFCGDIEPPSHYPVGDSDWDKWIELQGRVFTEFTYSGGISGYIQELGHKVAVKYAPRKKNSRVVEIGAGTSHHFLTYGQHYPSQMQYINIDTNFTTLKKGRELLGNKESLLDQVNYFLRGSIYHLPLASNSIDHILAIYVFEHLKYLQDAINEFFRTVKSGGTWCIVIPTEGGLAWTLGRKIMFSRQMYKRYGINYDRIMKFEHCNTCDDVVGLIGQSLNARSNFFPFKIPSPHLNAIAVLHGKKGESGKVAQNESDTFGAM